MADLATLRQRLLEAELALHRLMTGTLEVKVSVENYGDTTYAATDIDKLNAYIARLKSEIAAQEGRPRRKPLFIKF